MAVDQDRIEFTSWARNVLQPFRCSPFCSSGQAKLAFVHAIGNKAKKVPIVLAARPELPVDTTVSKLTS